MLLTKLPRESESGPSDPVTDDDGGLDFLLRRSLVEARKKRDEGERGEDDGEDG